MNAAQAPEYGAVVIVGAGQAGAEAATELRACGYTGTLTLVHEEEGVPYARPPLSKAYLLGAATEADLAIRPASVYVEQCIEILSGAVDSIDRDNRRVRLHDGRELPYDAVILATGGQPRRLAGCDIERASNVHYLKTLADATVLKETLRTSSKLVIVGGGYIGLEAAAAARQLGLQVTVLEAQPRRGFALHLGSPGQRFSLLHVDDLAAAVLAWLNSWQTCSGQTFSLDDGRPGGYDWPAVIEEAGGKRYRAISIPLPLINGMASFNNWMSGWAAYAPMLTPGKVRELTQRDWLCDNTAFAQATGWRPETDLADGIGKGMGCPR